MSSKTTTITVDGQPLELTYTDGSTTYRAEVWYIPDDEELIEESETGKYISQVILSVYLPEGETIRSRSDLTKDRTQRALNNWVSEYRDEKGHDIREIDGVRIEEIEAVRR